MDILILGGTIFLGRHLVNEALARGHRVTTFTRGRHNPNLFPAAQCLHGDRDGGLGILEGQRWDAVIDTSGHLPRLVRQAAEFLRNAVKHYTFISTLAVYADFPKIPGIEETAPITAVGEPEVETVSVHNVGPLKASCETAVENAIPGSTLIVRSGLLVGPYDPTDRFTYWPRRVALGGDVLVPGSPTSPVQLIDARDLSRWILDSIAQGRTGRYNVTGPTAPLTMGELLEACRVETRSSARIYWVDDQFLLSAGLRPMIDLPLWAAGAPGAARVNCRRAISAGLTFRPLTETIRDTFAWDKLRGDASKLCAGLESHREKNLLEAWGCAPARV